MSKRSKRPNNKRSNVKKQIARARKGSQIVRASKHTNESLNLNRKNLILLAVSVVLAITVTFAASFAWFQNVFIAKADIQMPVYKFDFSASVGDGEDKQILVNDGANTQEITLSTKMMPGKTCLIPLEFVNGATTCDVQYSLDVVSMNSPEYAVWKFGSSSNLTAEPGYKSLVGTPLITSKVIPENTTEIYYLYCDWVAVDNDTVNDSDYNFQKNNDGISITIEVNAQQVAENLYTAQKIEAESIANKDTCTIETDASASGGQTIGSTKGRKILIENVSNNVKYISVTYTTNNAAGSFNIFSKGTDNQPFALLGHCMFTDTRSWTMDTGANTVYSSQINVAAGDSFYIIASDFANIDYITLYS